MAEYKNELKISSGILGFDEISFGGYIPNKSYLVAGGPGCGKTILCLHFLEEGSNKGESCLFITLGEKEEQIRNNALLIGLKLKNVEFLDLSPSSQFFYHIESYDIFSPAEVEREPIVNKIK